MTLITFVRGGTGGGQKRALAAQRTSDWTCPDCGARCKYYWKNCPACGHRRPDN